jgi:hypothetical protein
MAMGSELGRLDYIPHVTVEKPASFTHRLVSAIPAL